MSRKNRIKIKKINNTQVPKQKYTSPPLTPPSTVFYSKLNNNQVLKQRYLSRSTFHHILLLSLSLFSTKSNKIIIKATNLGRWWAAATRTMDHNLDRSNDYRFVMFKELYRRKTWHFFLYISLSYPWCLKYKNGVFDGNHCCWEVFDDTAEFVRWSLGFTMLISVLQAIDLVILGMWFGYFSLKVKETQ